MHRIVLLSMLTWPLAAAPIRVQVTTGGHPHDISFYGLFENQNDLAVTVNPHPSAYRRNLRKFVDVLVLYDLDDVTSEKEQQCLRDFLESGGGLVVLHHALADNWQWKWWYEEVIGARYLMGQDGDMPRSQPKDNETLRARRVAAHPILEGVGDLRVCDEAYKGMWHSPKALVLMETDNPHNDRPVVWIGPWQKSRVVAIQIGHGPGAHNDPGYRRLVRNAILWTAHNKE
jgi:type 1 glutamine amidotransferase